MSPGEVQWPGTLLCGPMNVGAGLGCGEGLPPKNPKNACHHCMYIGNGAGAGWTLAGVI